MPRARELSLLVSVDDEGRSRAAITVREAKTGAMFGPPVVLFESDSLNTMQLLDKLHLAAFRVIKGL